MYNNIPFIENGVDYFCFYKDTKDFRCIAVHERKLFEVHFNDIAVIPRLMSAIHSKTNDVSQGIFRQAKKYK